MNPLLALIFCAVFTLRSMAATDEPTPRELHTAQCVAALEVYTDDLAAQVKAGRTELRPLLLDRLKQGAAFIGAAYLQGERDEDRVKGFLDTALEAQKALPKSALAARQSACAQEGAQLLVKADAFSRAIVSHLAQKRMKKLLDG